MTAAEIQAVRLELGRCARAKQDDLALKLLDRIERDARQRRRMERVTNPEFFVLDMTLEADHG